MSVSLSNKSRITFLGTGTSTGVPQLGCHCPVCMSKDPRDRRMRCSSLVEIGGKKILIDCGPDFYFQFLHRDISHFDAVLITHEHYDHVGGLDDLRPFSYEKPIEIYCNQRTADNLRARIPYCFKPTDVKGLPHLKLNVVEPHDTFYVGDVPITPVRVMHGRMEILGFKLGGLAYITDMKTMPDSELEYIKDARLLVLNALRPEPHPTHQTIDEAVHFALNLGVTPVYFIHMSHSIGFHADADAKLPEGMHFAYDGLQVEF